MSWREKLGIPENSDRSDKTIASVTSVTSSAHAQKVTDVIPNRDPELPEYVAARRAGPGAE